MVADDEPRRMFVFSCMGCAATHMRTTNEKPAKCGRPTSITGSDGKPIKCGCERFTEPITYPLPPARPPTPWYLAG